MAIEDRSAAWRIGQSWYVLLAFTVFFPFLAFLYMGIRIRDRRWLEEAGWFLLIVLLFMEILPRVSGRELNWVGTLFILGAWVVAIYEVFSTRYEFLTLLDMRQGGTPPPGFLEPEAPPQPAAPLQAMPEEAPWMAQPASPAAPPAPADSYVPPPPPAPAPPAREDAPQQPRGPRVVDF